jgi:hypothetical protein
MPQRLTFHATRPGKKKIVRHNQMSFAIGVTLGLASGVAIAQQQPEQRGFYGGLSLGQSRIKFVDSSLDGGRPAGVSSEETGRDETGRAWKLFAGYRIHRNVAIEGGYTDFGQFSTTRRFFSTRPTFSSLSGTETAIIRISGFHLESVCIIPIRDVSVLLKAGTMYSRTETSFSTTGGSQRRKSQSQEVGSQSETRDRRRLRHQPELGRAAGI